jgi:hypothetical protein
MKDREKLKKTGLFVVFRTQFYYSVAVAASIIILLGVYFRFVKQPEERNVSVTVETPIVKPIIQDQKSATIDNVNPVTVRRDNPIVINSETADIEKPEKNQTGRLSENFRMASLPGSKIITVNNTRLHPEDRRNEKLLALAADVVPEPERKKSFVSRFIAGLAGKVIKTDNLKGKSFLDYTIDGYNLMADKEVSLEKEVDENGKVIAYLLNGESVSFSRNKNLTQE